MIGRNLGRLAFPASLALWLGVCGLGFWVLLKYQTTPGGAGALAARWPAGSRLRPDPERSTLVIFAHPRCPCTRSSLDSLAWTMAHGAGRLTAYALFFKPADSPEGWEKTDLWEQASAIPGVRVLSDAAGAEARLFGAETSGQAALFDPRGALVFDGGITRGRGHFGDNPGRDAVVALVAGAYAPRTRHPVFGCSLLNAAAQRRTAGKPWKILDRIKTTTRT